jgi:RNA polymerase sigma factor (sigma-70 family)
MSFRGRLDVLMRRLRREVAPPDEAASDASLLGRFIAGRDQAAFELLLWRHGPMVLSVCRRMLRCDHDAEDAFQAAFLLLARKAASIRRRESVASWLHRTACRVALRARAAARRQPVAVPAYLEPAAPDAEPDIVWRDLRPVLDEEVQRLPEIYRLVIILCYFQGRTHTQAAADLGCPRGTIGVRLARARELLRKRLTGRGLALSAAALAVLAVERTASAAAPAAIIQATLKAALLFAARKAVAGAVSAQTVAWTQGVLRNMFLSKLRMLAAILLVTAVVGTGAGYLTTLSAAPPSPKAPAAPAAAAAPAKLDDAKSPVEVPAEEAGRLVLVGTEIQPGETVAAKDKVKVEVGFLAVEIDGTNSPQKHEGTSAPEKWWTQLDPTGKKIYARWKEGDPLPPGRLFVVQEEREYRKLHVGDAIEAGQLLGIVDEKRALDDVWLKINKEETAESEYKEEGKTKEEAQRRANESERLFKLGTGVISQEAYYADMLNAERYVEEEKGRNSALTGAILELQASLTLLKMHEIRSLDRGVVKEILKHRGEAVRQLEPIVRLEVEDAAATPVDRPTAPHTAPAGRAATVVHVPAQRDGVLLVVGTEIKEGEKVPADRVVVVKIDGQEKRYRRLLEGDAVEEGQLLARLDGRLARLDLETAEDKVRAAEAALQTTVKVLEETRRRRERLGKVGNAVSSEEIDAAQLETARAEGDEQIKKAELQEAQTQLKAADAVLGMFEVRSPVRGVVKAIGKNRGEAVKALETVVEIEEKE